MSGDKKIKTTKAEEIWYRLLLNDSFKKKLNLIKKFILFKPKKIIEYQFKKYALLEEYTKPFTKLLNLFDKYVFGKETQDKGLNCFQPDFPITLQTPSEEELKQSKRSFVKLWIYDGVSRDETIDYIKKNWQNIQTLIKIQGVKTIKRIRRIKDRKRSELILKYNRLSTKKLFEMAKKERETKQYREILISRLMEEKGYAVTEEIVKGVISRSKKNV